MILATRFRTITLLGMLILAALMLPPSPPSAQARPAPPIPTPNENLHFKSRAGLMPPAYGFDPSQPGLQGASAPQVTFINPYITAPTGGAAQVLAGIRLAYASQNSLGIGVGRYFDPPNDDTVQLFAMPGGTLMQTHKLPGGWDPETMVAEDFNQDGLVDMALGLAGAEELAIYTQPLTSPVRIALPGAPSALASGDFNGDLHPDLAVAIPQMSRIYLWASSPSGLVALPLNLAYPTGGYDALDSGDINNDGQDDIVALRGAGYTTDSVVIYPQQGATFPVSYTLSPDVGGYLPHSMDVGDVNSDGLDDVIVTAGGNTPYTYLNVFLQQRGSPMAQPIIYAANHLPSAIKIADINHDGYEDVLALNDAWRTLSVYTQTTSLRLAPYAVANIPYSSRYRPNALELTDLDGNGSLDVGLVDLYDGLVILTNMLTAPSATIVQPREAAIVPPGTLVVTGTASAQTVKVEVRLRGETAWQPALLNGSNWETTMTLPNQGRAWWIEARAIDAQGHVQAPVAQRRVGIEEYCYALADNGGTSSSIDRLMLVGTQTAHTILVGTPGTTQMFSLALHPTSGVIYAVNGAQFGSLDPATASFTPIGTALGKGNGAKGSITFSNINGLAFDSPTGKLYGIHRRTGSGNKDVLFQIDPASGTFIPNAFGSGKDYVVITGALDDVDDMAFDPLTNILYAVSNNNGAGGVLVTINRVSGAATSIGQLDVDNIEGLTFSAGGRLYGATGISWPETANRLWTINTTSGAASEVGAFSSEQDYEGLACVPPDVDMAIPPTAPLRVDRVAINAAARDTGSTSVTISAHTAGAAWKIGFTEYSYRADVGQWEAGATRWFDRAAAEAGVSWNLAAEAGMQYIQAWATDGAGNLSALPYQTFINYMPATATVEHEQRQIYRYMLNAGQQLTARLESLDGDADLSVWSSDPDAAPWTSAFTSAVDEVNVIAPADGLYQIEVHGYAATSYRLQVAVDGVATGGSPAAPAAYHTQPAQVTSAAKQPPSEPAMPLSSVPAAQRPVPPVLAVSPTPITPTPVPSPTPITPTPVPSPTPLPSPTPITPTRSEEHYGVFLPMVRQ